MKSQKNVLLALGWHDHRQRRRRAHRAPDYIKRSETTTTALWVSPFATRLENAEKLLCETDGKVESVACSSGHSSVKSFFIDFKQFSRPSPTEYRKRARRGRSCHQINSRCRTTELQIS